MPMKYVRQKRSSRKLLEMEKKISFCKNRPRLNRVEKAIYLSGLITSLIKESRG